jgi:hypothetical protein
VEARYGERRPGHAGGKSRARAVRELRWQPQRGDLAGIVADRRACGGLRRHRGALARIVRKVPVIGPTLNWKLLIADSSRVLPGADDATLKEWAYLETFSWVFFPCPIG